MRGDAAEPLLGDTHFLQQGAEARAPLQPCGLAIRGTAQLTGPGSTQADDCIAEKVRRFRLSFAYVNRLRFGRLTVLCGNRFF